MRLFVELVSCAALNSIFLSNGRRWICVFERKERVTKRNRRYKTLERVTRSVVNKLFFASLINKWNANRETLLEINNLVLRRENARVTRFFDVPCNGILPCVLRHSLVFFYTSRAKLYAQIESTLSRIYLRCRKWNTRKAHEIKEVISIAQTMTFMSATWSTFGYLFLYFFSWETYYLFL